MDKRTSGTNSEDHTEYDGPCGEIAAKALSELDSEGDMAVVGRSLMRELERHCPDWTPANDPAEIVYDLLNEICDRDAAISAFLEPYEGMSDETLRQIAATKVRLDTISGEYVTPHIATQILAFRKIIEQAGGKS